MSKNKELKYRAVCPQCGKPYDTRNGKNLNGVLLCPECYKALPFATLDDYRK